MEIKKLSTDGASEFSSLIEIFNEVFESDLPIPNEAYLQKLLFNPDFFVIVATANGKVIGGLTIYVLQQYYAEKPVAYIYDVGVSPNYQGIGVGKALMAFTCQYCQENNFSEAYVEAEYEDDEAIKFYRKTKKTSEMQAIHFNYDLSNLGKDE